MAWNSNNTLICEVKKMPNIKSAKKRVKVAKTKTLRNQMIKSSLKTAIKKFEAAVAKGDKATAEARFNFAIKKIDQAVAKGVLHKNNAAHKKSKLAAKMNKAG